MVPSAQRIDQYKREVDVSTYNLSWGGRVTRPVMSGRNNGHQNGNSIAADANGSGFLSLKEMRKAVAMAGVMLEQEELSMLMTMYDESNDGKVSFEEFGKAMIKQRHTNGHQNGNSTAAQPWNTSCGGSVERSHKGNGAKMVEGRSEHKRDGGGRNVSDSRYGGSSGDRYDSNGGSGAKDRRRISNVQSSPRENPQAASTAAASAASAQQQQNQLPTSIYTSPIRSAQSVRSTGQSAERTRVTFSPMEEPPSPPSSPFLTPSSPPPSEQIPPPPPRIPPPPPRPTTGNSSMGQPKAKGPPVITKRELAAHLDAWYRQMQ
jgi:hypothetical protein